MAGVLAVSTPVSAVGDDTPTYELVIPTTLAVSDTSGFNALDNGVTVKNLKNGTNVSSITVSAGSGYGWNLKCGDKSVPYGLYDSWKVQLQLRHIHLRIWTASLLIRAKHGVAESN